MFDPFDARLAVDPYPAYAAARENEPVHRTAYGFWVLMKHADVMAFSKNRDLLLMFHEQQVLTRGEDVATQPFMVQLEQMLGHVDPPDHTRVRRLLTPHFHPERWRAQMEAIAADLMAGLQEHGEMELVEDFALPFPALVISEILGVPHSDHERIAAAALQLFKLIAPGTAIADEDVQHGNDASAELDEYFRALIAQRRADPRDDLLTTMIGATNEGDRMTEDELVANAILLYVAGHETTAMATALGVRNLLLHPEALELLRARPELMDGAVQELFRHDAPVQASMRVTTEPLVFSGVEIPAGEPVLGYAGSGGRDPEKYPDPDRLDVTREVEDLLLFGVGIRRCLGARIASVQLEIAISRLLDACPGLRLAGEPVHRANTNFRGLDELRLAWG